MRRTELIPHNPLEGPRPEMVVNLHDGTDEHISIIIVNHNQHKYLNLCLQSLDVTSYANNFEVIVVDNGSDQENQDYLREIQDEVRVVRNDRNLYWSAAANRGVAAAAPGSRYFIFLHPDVVILNSGWMDLLVNVAESKRSGMVGLELHPYYVQNQKVEFIQEWCLLMTRDCWNNIGPWPEELPQVGMSFIMTMKAQRFGHQPQVMKSQVCHHYRVFGLDINHYERMAEQAMVTIPKLLRDVQSEAV